MSVSTEPFICPQCHSPSPFPSFYEDLKGNRFHWYCAKEAMTKKGFDELEGSNFCFNCDAEFLEDPTLDEDNHPWCPECAFKEWEAN